jgi:hypothetical protein
MKRCCSCKRDKPLEEFHRRSASADGRQGRCRDCARAHYRAHADELRAASERRIVRVRADNRRRLADHLLAHPCVDCGESDVRVLDFDHRVGTCKRADVGRMLASRSWEVIVAEIAKCDVRCANCHRRRTCERGGWWRQGVHEDVEEQSAGAAAARLRAL